MDYNLVTTSNPLKPFLNKPLLVDWKDIMDLDKIASENVDILFDIIKVYHSLEEGYTLVYGLDFDIIYAYANPEDVKVRRSMLSQYLIEEDKNKFTLLPGTVIEILNYQKQIKEKIAKTDHLIYKLSTNCNKKEIINDISLIKDEIKNVENVEELNKSIQELEFDISEFIRKYIVKIKDRYLCSLKRIKYILEKDNLIKFDEIYDSNLPNYIWNKEVKRKIEKEIELSSSVRKTMFKNNEIDAINVATVISYLKYLNRNLKKEETYKLKNNGKQKYILRLLTNTELITKLKYVDDDIKEIEEKLFQAPTTMKNRSKSSIYAILGLEALYTAIISKHTKSGKIYCFDQYESSDEICKAIIKMYANFKDLNNSSIEISMKENPQLYNALNNYSMMLSESACYQEYKAIRVLDEQETINKQNRLNNGYHSSEDFGGNESFEKIARENLDLLTKNEFLKYKFEYDKEIQDDLCSYGFVVNDKIQGAWRLENQYYSSPEEVFTLRYFPGTEVEATWSATLLESNVCKIINILFLSGKGSIPINTGEARIVFANGNSSITLFKLPLVNEMRFEKYKKIIKYIGNKSDNKDSLPMFISCNTDICDIRFDIFVPDTRGGIIFTIKDPRYIHNMIDLYKHTSNWMSKGDKKMSNKLMDFIEDNVRRLIEE